MDNNYSFGQVLENNLESQPFPLAISKVKQKVISFHAKMNLVAEYLKDHDAPADLQIDVDQLLLQYYIDGPALQRLNVIAAQPGFHQIGVFFALEDVDTQGPLDAASTGFGRITGCFVGLDADDKVIASHFPAAPGLTAAVDAEDTWPPKPPIPTRSGVVFPSATSATSQGAATTPPNIMALSSKGFAVSRFFEQ